MWARRIFAGVIVAVNRVTGDSRFHPKGKCGSTVLPVLNNCGMSRERLLVPVIAVTMASGADDVVIKITAQGLERVVP
jgi:hypothetical protein